MAGRFSVEAVFKAVDKVTAPVTRMQNRVGKLTRSMGRGFQRLNKTVDKFSSGIKKGGIAVVASLALTTAAMADVVSIGAEFEQTLVNAAAKFPGEIRKGTEAFKLLEDAAKKTGATTEFTASQAAQALNFLAMAGFDAEGAVAALPGVVDLATSAQIDLATATDVASDSLGAFNLMTKDSAQLGKNLARVNDVIAKTATSANTTVEDLFEAMKEGGPVATTAGASIETFSALAGELANAGIKGSRAGTTLKNMFLGLAAPTAGASKILKRLGVQTQDADGNLLDIVDVLGSLNKSLDGLGTAERSGVLEGIFGKIPIAGVNVLLGSGAKKLNAYRKELEGASGASTKMASVMRDTLQGRLKSLNSAIEGVKIQIFSMTSGPLSDAVDKMTEWVRANQKVIATKIGAFISGLITNFKSIVKWVKRIGIGLAVFFAFTAVLKTLVLVMTAVNLVMAANPIGLIILGIMALIAIVSTAIIWWDELKASFMEIGWVQTIIKAFEGAALLIQGAWEPVGEFFGSLWDGVIQTFNSAVEIITGIADKVSSITSGIVDTISSIGGGVADFFGFGDDEEEQGNKSASESANIVTPQERVAKTIEEKRSTSTAEVTIKDETGRAEVTGGTLGNGLMLQPSGAF